MEKVIYSKFSNEREGRFNIRTDIVKDEEGNKYIIKSATEKESQQHVDNLIKWNQGLLKSFEGTVFVPNKAEKIEKGVKLEFLQGKTLEEVLDECINEDKRIQAFEIIDKYVSEIRKAFGKDKFEKSADFQKIFGDVKLAEGLRGNAVVDIDLIFQNIIVDNETWNVIDYEWTFECCVPVNFVIYRALFYFTYMVEKRKKFLGGDIYQKCGITDVEVEVYAEMEKKFQMYVSGNGKSLIELQNEVGKRKIRMDEILCSAQNSEAINTIQIYQDTGNGWEESKSCFIRFKPYAEEIHVIDFAVERNVRAIRIDPALKSCAVEVSKFYSNDDENANINYITNGFCLKQNVILFEKDDPQIIITEVEKDIRRIHLELRISDIDKKIIKDIVYETDLKSKVIEENERNIVINQSKIQEQRNEIEKQKIRIEEQKKQIEEQKRQIEELYGEIEKKKLEISEQKSKIAYNVLEAQKYAEIIAEKEQMIADKERHIQNLSATIFLMETSVSWRITRPVRLAGRVLRKIKPIRYVGKGVKVIRRKGIGGFWKICRDKQKARKGKIQVHEDTVIAQIEGTTEENTCIMKDIPLLENCDKRIAVHVHLYYVDLLSEILGYLNNIPYKFDVYISCQENANVSSIKKRVKCLKNVKNVDIQPLPNRGRDIAPLYVWFADRIVNYDYVLHIHSKKSLYTGSERTGWRQYSLSSLLGSEEIVKKIFWLFEEEKNIGIAYPDNHEDVPMLAYSWLVNEGLGREFLKRLGIPFESGIFMYPAGSFFWAKIEAIKPLFDAKLKIEDFPEEAGQTDGTLAHVIERATGFVVKNCGYHSAIIDYREGVIRHDISLKAFRPYLDADISYAKNHLRQYDVISFDIFDTLISRGILHPDDVFRLMQEKIKNKYQQNIDFLRVRKQAEVEAWEKKQAYTNIDDIYEEIEKITGMDSELVEKIKQLEIDLEYNLSIPRRDMREIFNALKDDGKTIILVSDMYLTRSYIEKMLEKCGYSGYDEIWISCECGLRKDQDNIWDAVLKEYEGKRFIHVGDNVRSDWQTLIDRKQEAYWIMNPIDEWKLSPYFNKLGKYDDGNIVNSLLLGMTLNGGIFNSPFVLTREAQPEVEDSFGFGMGVFGPLFYRFIQWLQEETPDDAILAFLAREGYILEPLYETIITNSGQKPKEHCYFLASRRTVTVAGIKEIDDAREIVSKYYRGTLSNLLEARFGIELPEEIEDKVIMLDEELTDNINEVMDILKNHGEKYISQFAEEKNAYIKYIQELIPQEKWEKLSVVDVGYSGTIQYYLAKLLDKKVRGYYLATFNNTKPDKIGCICEGLYNPKKDFLAEISRSQLFLESVLQAPYGQLIKFVDENGNIIPKQRQAESVKKEIVELQNGIMEYCNILGTSLRDVKRSISDSEELVEVMYSELLNGKVMKESLADIFTVEDDYCSNGVLRFSKEQNKWI